MQLLLLSFALSMDSAALNMANGARYKSLALGKILFIAFMLGFFQFLMPLLTKNKEGKRSHKILKPSHDTRDDFISHRHLLPPCRTHIVLVPIYHSGYH